MPGWTLVRATGRDAERFLHSQLTSDVKALEPGTSQLTALLDRGGRLQAFGFLRRLADRIELLLPAESVETAVQLLSDHVIADDVSLEAVDTPQMRLALGAEAVRLASQLDPDLTFPIDGFASRGFVTWGPTELDLPPLDLDELEARRVLTGLPRWGAEVRGGELVHETTLIDTAIAFDKGCFLGQETVAKVASGRGAARAPMLLEVVNDVADAAALVGRSFETGAGTRGGTVLSAAWWQGRLFLLAAVVRELRIREREVVCRFVEGPVLAVRTRSLPHLTPPQPEAWARGLELEAVEAFSADRETDAIVLYERAIAVCPSYADAYEALGVILGRHGRYEEAIALMRRLLEIDPSSVMAHTNLSLYFNQLGQIENAEREAAEAMRAKLRRERHLNGAAEFDGQRAESAAADRQRRAEMFRHVLELDPADPLGNFGLGELLLEEERYREAVQHLERALDADPRYSAALLALGRALEGSEDLDAARDTYRRGVEVAAGRGDLATANRMQERLAVLETRPATE